MSDPLISLVLITFNQEEYVKESVTAALAQTYQPIEIVVCDDCSSDDTYANAESLLKAYDGPASVALHRNEQNLGFIGNLNAALRCAKGELIVIAAGDDISLPKRVETLVKHWQQGNNVQLLYSASEVIDEDGNALLTRQDEQAVDKKSVEEILKSNCFTQGATCAVARRLMTEFGEFLESTVNEDRAWPLRAKLTGNITYIDQPLVKYRTSGLSRNIGRVEVLTRQLNDYKQKLADLQSFGATKEAWKSICENKLVEYSMLIDVEHGRLNVFSVVKQCFQQRVSLKFGTKVTLRCLFALPIKWRRRLLYPARKAS